MQAIQILVKAKSGKSCVEFDDDVCRVFVKSSAEKGAANLEVVKLLSKHFKVPVRIISGFRSRKKLVQVMQ